MLKPLPIIFKEISEAPTHLEKVQTLKINRNAMVDLLLELTFSKDTMITGLPEGKPETVSGESSLYNAHLLYANRRQIEMFINDNTAHLNSMKREKLFLDLLENLDPSEVNLLCEVKDRKLTTYPGITRTVIEKIYDWPLEPVAAPEVAEPAPVEETPAPVVEEVKVEEPVVVEPEVKEEPVKKTTRRKPAAKKTTTKKTTTKKAPAKKTTTRRRKPTANTSSSTS